MSNVTIHLVIPVLLVLATRLFPTRQVLLFAPFAVVPDLDTAINLFTHHFLGETVFAHRSLLHNVFVFLPTLVLAVFLWARMLRGAPHLSGRSWYERWLAFGTVRWGYASVLITFYLFTHVLLDTFSGGTTFLWPLLDVYFYPRIFIFVDMATGAPTATATVVSGQGAPQLSSRYPWMTPEQVAIWILVAIGAMAGVAREAMASRTTTGQTMADRPETHQDRSVPPGPATNPYVEKDDPDRRSRPPE